MQTLSDNQLREVTRLIEDHHNAFLVRIGLSDALPKAAVDRLLALGLVTKSQVKRSYLEDAFSFGMLADAFEESKAKNMPFDHFREWLMRQPLPMSQEERVAVKHLKRSMATHLRGLGNRVDKTTQEVLVDADQDLRRRLAATVKRELVQGIERRKSIGEVVAALRKSTEDYVRDWQRIAVTEVNNAFQEGKLATIQKANKGRDPWVFKRVKPDACPECHYNPYAWQHPKNQQRQRIF
jgi:hypothetical protein